MEAELFAKILSDKNIVDLKKLAHKYPQVEMRELVELFKTSVYQTMPLWDFNGNDIVYMKNIAQVQMSTVKLFVTPQGSQGSFGLKAMEDEIASTFSIENIDFNRESVRKILQGYAPTDEQEKRIYGMKKGLEFIANPTNVISEKNIFILYEMVVGQYLNDEDSIVPGSFYRHDSVYIMGQGVEHTGLSFKKLPKFMERFVVFINQNTLMNDLIKASVIHFYFAFLHPYFDGNGRMARLLHMWYLRQQGYPAALFVPLSSFIERSRQQYYKAYTLAEENAKLTAIMDITPFLVYFIEHVYNKLNSSAPQETAMDAFYCALKKGQITAKEKDLWFFVLSAYGNGEFSTKQLERDFGEAAYATIRGFVLKLTDLGVLSVQKYGNRAKYSVRRM